MVGFFGAGGLGFPRVEAAVDELVSKLGDRLPWGVNLIHSPNEPALENRVADLLLRKGVKHHLRLGLHGPDPGGGALRRVRACTSTPTGRIARKHQVFAKISRGEVATRFMSPAPADMLRALVEQRLITHAEAELAARVPVAEDVTVEADSGGHTDNQSLVALFPTIMALRDELVAQHEFDRPIRVGAAGGLGTPGLAWPPRSRWARPTW